MSHESTRPLSVGGDQIDRLWQHSEIAWSFGALTQTIVAPLSVPTDPSSLTSTGNAGLPTVGPQVLGPPPEVPATVRPRSFGKRGFDAIHDWMGVVESVSNSGFTCRITPVQNGRADPAAVQYTEFTFDDLESDTECSMAVPGAAFYWTVGKARNAAGTIANTSLVRFRRLPIPTSAQLRSADETAALLLEKLNRGAGLDTGV